MIQPGLEQVLADELRALRIDARVATGGAIFEASSGALHGIHVHGRTPTRVWVRLGHFPATHLDGLARGARELPWGDYVWPRQELDVRVTAHQSRLRHRDRIERKLAYAVKDALRAPRGPRSRRHGAPPAPAKVLVRIEHDQVEISVDASGEPLYRRGWRRDVGPAPLRENLAAAVLRLAGWSPGIPLVDPMCGSGTFCIEAATWAAGLPPGGRRAFAFEAWPSHDAHGWKAAQKTGLEASPVAGAILGADRDPRAIVAAQSNARRAQVDARITFRHTDVSALEAPTSRGLVVANPPWGDRLRDADAAWAALGATLRRSFRGWRVAVLVPRMGLLRHLGFRLDRLAQFPAGGIRISVCSGQVPG